MIEDRFKINVSVKYEGFPPEDEYQIERTYTDIKELFSKIPEAHRFIYIFPHLPPENSFLYDNLKKLWNKFGTDSA